MDSNGLFALTLHILGVVFWVGGLFVLALLLAAAQNEEAPVRARLGTIARRLGIPLDAAAGVAMAAGISLLVMRAWDLRQPWMHVKLTFVVGLLAVHGIVRVRAKRLATGGAGKPSGLGAAIGVALLAVAIIAVVVLKPMAR